MSKKKKTNKKIYIKNLDCGHEIFEGYFDIGGIPCHGEYCDICKTWCPISYDIHGRRRNDHRL